MKTKRTALPIFLLVLVISLVGCATSKTPILKAEKQGWKLSMQSYTFRLFSAVEALDKTSELGLKYIEIYPGQKMGVEFGNATFGYNLTTSEQEKLKKLAASKGIRIVSSGVWSGKRDEWEKIFGFAANMGLEFISAEPAKQDLDIIDNLARRYNIKVAIHNHPNEASYWNPEILLSSLQDRSNLLGACIDVGHYKRMGLEPLDCLKKLEGRIFAFHFKDIVPVNGKSTFEDVIWGTGVLNVEDMLRELKRQKFKGYFTIEYENNWENNLPEIRSSLDYFKRVVNDLF